MTWIKKVRLGSVSILFTVIVVCVAVLSVLTVSTVRADASMAERYAEQVTSRYEMQNQGQLWLSEVAAALSARGWDVQQDDLPEGSVLEGNTISVTLETPTRTLSIALTLYGEALQTPQYQITSWIDAAKWEADEDWNLLQ